MNNRPNVRVLSEQELPESQPEPAEGSREYMPLNELGRSTTREGDWRIYIKRSVYQQIAKHLNLDRHRELGGFLIGNFCRDPETDLPFVRIENVIEAQHIRSNVVELEFTTETMITFYQEHQDRFPTQDVLGWYHSHPDHGIFLSQKDTFIHENFFKKPYQMALVIDPQRQEGGFFQWHDQSLSPTSAVRFYEIPDTDEKTPIQWKNVRSRGTPAVEQAPALTEEEQEDTDMTIESETVAKDEIGDGHEENRKSRFPSPQWQIYGLAAALVVFLGIALFSAWGWNRGTSERLTTLENNFKKMQSSFTGLDESQEALEVGQDDLRNSIDKLALFISSTRKSEKGSSSSLPSTPKVRPIKIKTGGFGQNETVQVLVNDMQPDGSGEIKVGDRITVQVMLEKDSGTPSQRIFRLGTEVMQSLFDDGQHQDENPEDGIWAQEYEVTERAGVFANQKVRVFFENKAGQVRAESTQQFTLKKAEPAIPAPEIKSVGITPNEGGSLVFGKGDAVHIKVEGTSGGTAKCIFKDGAGIELPIDLADDPGASNTYIINHIVRDKDNLHDAEVRIELVIDGKSIEKIWDKQVTLDGKPPGIEEPPKLDKAEYQLGETATLTVKTEPDATVTFTSTDLAITDSELKPKTGSPGEYETQIQLDKDELADKTELTVSIVATDKAGNESAPKTVTIKVKSNKQQAGGGPQ